MKAFHPALAFSLRRPLRKQARAPVLAPWPSSEREGLSGAGGVEMGAKVGQINTAEDPLLISTSVDYEKLQQLGEGVRGQVYMARDIHTGEIVTLKKINEGDENEGVPVWFVRETRILGMLHHENIIQLKHTFMSREGVDGIYRGSTYMVFEYMPSSLKNLVEHPEVKMTAPQIKSYMLQLLRGLQYCHANHVLHRNIKGSNLLIDNNGNLKIADFGLARISSTDPDVKLTGRVVTLWYRAPELLLGARKYGPAVDIWSAGCIFAELLRGQPIFCGKSEADQLSKIFQLCGTPNRENWTFINKLPLYHTISSLPIQRRRIREFFSDVDCHAVDLLDMLFRLNPDKRISAEKALDAEYFRVEPLPCDPNSMPKYAIGNQFEEQRRSLRHTRGESSRGQH